MLSFFSKNNFHKIGFEDMKIILGEPSHSFCIINTLLITEQEILIPKTIKFIDEEQTINDYITNYETKRISIIVYGKNSCDNTAEKKCLQLCVLGFTKVFLYVGGLFEWILLQDIYGLDEFPTTSKVMDILKYRPQPCFTISRGCIGFL